MFDPKDLKNLDADTLLGALGLQRTSAATSIAPMVGALVVGAVVGGALALVLAPQSGAALRRRIKSKADDVKADAEKAFDRANGKNYGSSRPVTSP